MKIVHLEPPQIAWGLLAAGAGLHFLLPTAFRGTPIRPTENAATLVRSGPFRFSRNPMYLGIVIMLLGVAAWVGSLPMLIPPIGFFVFMSAVFIPYEESRLRQSFGGDYASYSRRVRRWV